MSDFCPTTEHPVCQALQILDQEFRTLGEPAVSEQIGRICLTLSVMAEALDGALTHIPDEPMRQTLIRGALNRMSAEIVEAICLRGIAETMYEGLSPQSWQACETINAWLDRPIDERDWHNVFDTFFGPLSGLDLSDVAKNPLLPPNR